MEELISKRMAIDTLLDWEMTYDWDDHCREEDPKPEYIVSPSDVIKKLPSLQSEIIYCKYCKHFIREDREEYTPYGFYNTYFNAFCDKHFDVDLGEFIDVKLDDFCSFADRRE